jgi:hypothetical protein
MSGFGIDASTPRKATKANEHAYSPPALHAEARADGRKLERGLPPQGPGVRRTHKGIATAADHIWIARNRGKFILIARVDWTQPVLSGVVRQ